MIRWLDSQWTSTIQGPKSQKVHRFPCTFFGPWGFTFFQTCSKVLNSSHWLPIPNTTNDFHMTGGWGSRHLEGMYFAKPLLFHGSNFPAKTTPCLSWRRKQIPNKRTTDVPTGPFPMCSTSNFNLFCPWKSLVGSDEISKIGTLCLFSGAKMLFVIFGRVKYRSNYNIPSEFLHYH